MDEVEELNVWRNRVAEKLCNLILNTIATKTYRDFIDGAIRLGMHTAAGIGRAERN